MSERCSPERPCVDPRPEHVMLFGNCYSAMLDDRPGGDCPPIGPRPRLLRDLVLLSAGPALLLVVLLFTHWGR